MPPEPSSPSSKQPRSPGAKPAAPAPRPAASPVRSVRVKKHRESKKAKGERAREIARRLSEVYEAHCELTHTNPYELLAATILSAQCTDERVNMVTPALFRRYPAPADLAVADPDELESIIRSTGFYKNKARSLLGMAQALEDRYDGEVPTALEDLVTIPGVGRKTGNVVRSVDFGLPGLPVDTHVTRISRLLALTEHTDAVKIEHELGALVPPEEWGPFSLRLILHGRRVCVARRPACDRCLLVDLCPGANPAMVAPA